MPRLLNLSLKSKAAASITLLFVGLMALVAGVQTQAIRAAFVEEVTEQQSELVAEIARELDQKLATNLLALTREAQVIGPDTLATPENLRSYLDQQPSMLLLFDSLSVISPTGDLLADMPRLAARQGLKIGDREYFKRSLATGKPVISMPIVSRATGRPTVTMLAPIRDREGRIAGFLAGGIDLLKSNFLGAIASTSIGRGGEYFVITTSDPPLYVVHPDRALILKQVGRDGAAEGDTGPAFKREGTMEGADRRGIPGLFSYKSIAATDWAVGSNYPLSEALAPVHAAERRSWLISAILGVVLAPLVWLLTWYLIAPLMRLRDEVQRLRKGWWRQRHRTSLARA